MADRRTALALTAGGVAIAAGVESAAHAALARSRRPEVSERALSFDDGWLFQRGEGQGLEAVALDDAGWRKLTLPHDWSVEDLPGRDTPFDKKALAGTATGFTTGGEGWYRKHFRVDQFPAGRRIEILFEGAYLESDVWLNGRHLGRNVHGYIPFAFDLTPFLDRTGDNVLAVRVRNPGKNSRWYSGSGIYLPVKLNILPGGARLARWGVSAWTRSLSGGRADIALSTRVDQPDARLKVASRLRDDNGKVVAQAISPAAAQVEQSLSVRGPKLWSAAQPSLYTLETALLDGDKTVDLVTQPFGIRIITFDTQRGMCVNGDPVKLRGGCVHHDNGLLGACSFADAADRRVRLLKERGFNAIRSSHNPSSPHLREACDRLGMFLIEEAFDAWHVAKLPQDFATQFPAHWEEVIRAMVLPARNSPSVIMWSIGNEIPDRSTDEGVKWQWMLANAVKRLDATRPVTAGLNGSLGAPMIAAQGTARPGRAGKVDNASTIFLDIPGYNYRLNDIQRERKEHPERVVYASETFASNMVDYARLMEREPWFLGEFLWTAMDYIGEAGIGATVQLKNGTPPFGSTGWPWVNAWCGDIDLIGHQKAASLARDVVWGLSQLEMTVHYPVPEGMYEYVTSWGWPDERMSWNWEGQEGKPLTVRFYTPGDRVEVLLNGSKIGEAKVSPEKMRAEYAVPYAPGTIEAVAYRGGTVIGRRRLTTTGAPAAIRCTAEQRQWQGGQDELSYVQIEIRDASGRIVPVAQDRLAITVEGPAELLAFGSADPKWTGSVKSPETAAFRGRALAILRGQGKSGRVSIRVSAKGLRDGSVTLG